MSIPFQSYDWSAVERSEHPGEKGTSYWQTLSFENFRVRIVEYSPGYLANHWCSKGHVVYCLDGAIFSEQAGDGTVELKKGMSYVVSDGESSHRAYSKEGAKLLIIDGDFLK